MITPRSFFVVRVFATRVPINNVGLLDLLDVSTCGQKRHTRYQGTDDPNRRTSFS